MMHRRWTLLAIPLVLALASTAEAQPEYPSAIEQHLGLGYTVPCSVCHDKGNTGSGTVTTPFGWAMRGQGLVADDPSSVNAALDALKSAKTDSDGDGADDIAELVAGTDPNSAGSVPFPNGTQPGYGCGGTAPTGHRGAAILPLPLLVLAARALRRRWRKS
jgi:hypothetical protein